MSAKKQQVSPLCKQRRWARVRNFREESEGLRSLSRGNAHTQSLGYRHGDGRSTEGRRRKKDRRFNSSGSTPRLRPRPPGGWGASARGGAPWAELLSRLSRKGKRSLSGPKSVHASRGALFKPRDHADCSIPGVLFPGSCRPDCTLSHHTVQASAASAALREGRSPQGERGRNT